MAHGWYGRILEGERLRWTELLQVDWRVFQGFMTEFVIKLADERGRVQEQSHAASTAEELRARFTQAGYYVYSVKAKSMLGASKKKVKLETFLIFNQQFLTLIKAGLPILGSLELLARRQKLPHFRAQLEDVAARVKTGESISQAFEAQGGFPIVYTTTLLAGERSGNLEEVLQRFLDFQRVSTTFLLDLGREAQEYGIYAAVVLGIVGFVLYRWSKTDAGANLIDKIRIALPLFGPVWLKYQVGLFSRTLSTLLTGGLPLVPSLETAAKSIDSPQIAGAVHRSVETVREGKGLSVSLQSTKVFPELAIEMIEVGESTGALPQMLNSVAEFFEEDVQTNLTAAMSLIEPLILIMMGLVVTTILIALYLPIFSLSAGGSGGAQ